MKIIIALIISLACSIGVYSQTNPIPGNSGNNPQIILPDTARYRIVLLPPPFSAIKLDRYTGKTYIYSIERKWSLLNVRGGLPAQRANSTVNYEIYDEDDLVFLINLETGESWILNLRSWEPIID